MSYVQIFCNSVTINFPMVKPKTTNNKQVTTDKTQSPAASRQPTSKGILLVALGAPEYGNMAANLAASIRCQDREILIHLVHTDRSVMQLTPAHRAMFTSMALCPEDYYTRQERQGTRDEGRHPAASPSPATCHLPPAIEYIKAKTHIYELSPYDETLFLDVDMYILPGTRMSEVISQLSAVCDYTIENRGYADLSLPAERLDPHYCNWVNIVDVKRHFKTGGRFYHLHSEFIFYKKNRKNREFFDKVREIYDTRPLRWQVFDGGVPDEYAFDIATAIMGHYPHRDGYIAIYWHGMDGRRDWNKDIIKNYIGFSLGGNFIPQWISQKVVAYKQLFKKTLGLSHLFNVPPKRRWNLNRRGI
jgi:hypothetical protein